MEEVRKDFEQEGNTMYLRKVITSPIGPLTLVASDEGLIELRWGAVGKSSLGENKILSLTELQLAEYFAGKRTAFNIPLSATGTEFQKRVWLELTKIPYGETWSYGELAKKIGRDKAARAVGAANGKNPIGIIVPCHRVIGASGSLTGFAGGLEIKSRLLALEKKLIL